MAHKDEIEPALKREGRFASGAPRTLVLACGALAREITAIMETNRLTHIDLHCLPAIYHNHPEKIIPALESALPKYREAYETIFIAYADCGTGGQLQAFCEAEGLKMIAGPHCYAFFEGVDAFAKRDEVTAFYLTDFLARQFDAFVWKPLGLDRHPELLDMYFSHYTKLVYLAQVDDPDLTAKAQDAARRMGLEFERQQTGYGDLTAAITEL